MSGSEEEWSAENYLVSRLKEQGANHASPVEGDVYVEWYLSDLLEFCQNYRSEIEELG